jgi:DNA repair protein RadC
MNGLRFPVYELKLVRRGSLAWATGAMSSSAAVAAAAHRLIGSRDCEHMAVFFLNSQAMPLGVHIVAIGSVSGVTLRCTDAFKAAIVANASAVILAHNHPGGVAEPSKEDRAFTRRFVAAAQVLGLSVLDHVIVALGGGSYSFFDAGAMPEEGAT